MIEYQVHTLKNGIRVLYQHHPSAITHCCMLINAGGRDEEPGEDGLAHFIEHLLFKATEKRNTAQILNRLDCRRTWLLYVDATRRELRMSFVTAPMPTSSRR